MGTPKPGDRVRATPRPFEGVVDSVDEERVFLREDDGEVRYFYLTHCDVEVLEPVDDPSKDQWLDEHNVTVVNGERRARTFPWDGPEPPADVALLKLIGSPHHGWTHLQRDGEGWRWINVHKRAGAATAWPVARRGEFLEVLP